MTILSPFHSTAGVDYEISNASVTFLANGSSIQCFNVTLLSDGEFEPAETFAIFFNLSNPRIQLGPITNVTITIIGMECVSMLVWMPWLPILI